VVGRRWWLRGIFQNNYAEQGHIDCVVESNIPTPRCSRSTDKAGWVGLDWARHLDGVGFAEYYVQG